MAAKDDERTFNVELYERPDGAQPAEAYILALPEQVLPRLFAFVDDIAENWPLRRSPGPEWQPLHAPATGCHEVRIRSGKTLYRLFAKLDGARRRLVLLEGATKRVDQALPAATYRRIAAIADDYMKRRKVSPPG